MTGKDAVFIESRADTERSDTQRSIRTLLAVLTLKKRNAGEANAPPASFSVQQAGSLSYSDRVML
jgi:hypothetical protein